MKRWSKLLLPWLLLGLVLPVHAEEKPEEWEHQVELYLLGIAISGTAGFGIVEGVELDVETDDILEKLDWAFMGRYEGYNTTKDWGVSIDYSRMDLSADFTGPLNGVVDMGVSQNVLEAFAFKRREMGKKDLDFTLGFRRWSTDVDIAFDPAVVEGSVGRGVDSEWVDFFVGTRITHKMTDNLYLSLRGDLGAGGSEATYLVQAGLWWQVAPNWQVKAGYKSLWVEFDDGTAGDADYFLYDTRTSGGTLGVTYQF